ncbi:TlpA disulfide reductase family protein [Flavobacterium chungnamense]|uniref:Thioredoxin domain-containing protein n=1 Tax=Flavobacterium chungnamense TaxID=706182 RepID=A0ABP7V1R1_9FLAO
MRKLHLLLLLFGFLSYSQQNVPNIKTTSIDGKTVSIQTDFLEKDKLYLFSFWATWCSPCIQELDAINEVYEDWKKNLNVELIAVSTDDSRTQKRVKPLVNGKGWNYTILLDTNQEFKRSLGISNIPYLIVIKNGKIVFTENGHTPGNEDKLFEKLKSL